MKNIAKTAWKKEAQPGELIFHQTNEWRNTAGFMEQTIKLMEGFGYKRTMFKGQVIIDLGCGSKLRSKFFTDALIVGIEPLGSDFIKTVPWNDLNDAYKVFSAPAEKTIKELEGAVKFIMCINVFDHMFDVDKVLENCYKYLQDDGEFLLSVDIHKETNPMHPVSLTPKKLVDKIKKSGFKIIRSTKGLGLVGDNYGHGIAYTHVLHLR
ncbi:hypothetical protein HYV64_02895 [Candidatus Shapirobacteria bacterium]|nr:hypothetical protein [Candidatus Shapirobacteria bacterium]